MSITLLNLPSDSSEKTQTNKNHIHREFMDRKHPFYTFQKIFCHIFEEIILCTKTIISQACDESIIGFYSTTYKF